ncbi:MAG: FecR domain-containing protein [Burkholderiales bacterium]|nr:FecR domain-containing protein [Burkholderiales bacterium]
MGETTMVIGRVTVVGVDGASRTVDRGMSIRVGDRIETQAGGHVHLRFVDGGRLSIRPASILQVEDYSHSTQQPLLGAIKFRLDEGVVRSITGSWGEAARDRFRLNTPVAAIGVKGTDFVVKSDGGKTSASVYTGAIMLTPLVNGCITSVGPCLNGNEKLLSEDMKGQMLELNRQQATPQLVPSVDLLAHSVRAHVGTDMAARANKPLPLDEVHMETRNSDAMVTDSRAAIVVASIPPQQVVVEPPMVVPPFPVVPDLPSVPVMPVVPDLPVAVSPPEVVTPPAPVVTPPVTVVTVVPQPVVPAAPPQVSQLVWARYNWVEKMDADTFSRAFADAITTGYERLPGNGNYTLFRQPSAPGTVLTTTDVTAEFRLASSSVQLARDAGRIIEPVTVNDGTFNVDFARSSFVTQLNMSNPAMGADTLVASGNIRSDGVLQTVSSNASINGALTLDGKEAGYAFEKAVKIGNIRGITLWGR